VFFFFWSVNSYRTCSWRAVMACVWKTVRRTGLCYRETLNSGNPWGIGALPVFMSLPRSGYIPQPRVCQVRRRRTKHDPGYASRAISLRRRRYTKRMAIRDIAHQLDAQQNSLQRLSVFPRPSHGLAPWVNKSRRLRTTVHQLHKADGVDVQ